MLLSILETVVYYCLLWIYVPLYILGLGVIKLKLKINQLKQLSGFKYVYQGVMSPLTKRSKVCDIGVISTEEEIDFLTHRSLAYITRMTLWTARELAKLAVRRQKIELISDSQLCYVLFNTVFSHALTWDKDRQMYCFDLADVNEFTLFEGFYWEAQRVYVNPNTAKVVIIMDNGKELHSDCSKADKPDYDLAKLHMQICMTYFAPGLGHNYVHFVFPSSVCIYAKRLLRNESVLYQLLSPHFRFMERLNYQALRICHASSNTRTFFDRIFCFWKPFPVTKEQFSGHMEMKLEQYYINIGSKDCNLRENGASNGHVSSNGTNGAHKESKPEQQRAHALFPPDYVTDQTMQKIPYLSYLSQYYEVIRGFVQEMEPHIDRDEWSQLRNAIAQHVPRFEHVDMIDGIATFIHMVAVVHSVDHTSYTDYFARRYGCMSIRTPFESYSNTEFWKDFSSETGIPVQQIKHNPLKLICQLDVMRMRCFTNVFVDYVPSPTCDLSLLKTDYNFTSYGADMAARNFISNLRRLDGNLKTQAPSMVFDRRKGEDRSTGMQLVKLETFVRSNCY